MLRIGLIKQSDSLAFIFNSSSIIFNPDNNLYMDGHDFPNFFQIVNLNKNSTAMSISRATFTRNVMDTVEDPEEQKDPDLHTL